jgi:hypothetical protein
VTTFTPKNEVYCVSNSVLAMLMIANNHRYDAKNYRITELANEARIGVRNL